MKCSGKTKDGQPCKAPPLTYSKFCFFHDDKVAAQRRAAHAAGGHRARKLRPTLPANYPVPKFKRPRDITKFLAGIVKCTLTGEVDSKLAGTAGYLCSIALQSMQAGNESKVARVEFLLAQPASLAVPEDKYLLEYNEEKKKQEERERRNQMKTLPPMKRKA